MARSFERRHRPTKTAYHKRPYILRGGALIIGEPVSGGTVGSILFVGAGPVLAQDNANLFWDDPANVLRVPTLQLGIPSSVTGLLKLCASGDPNFSTIQAGDAPVSDVAYKWPSDNPAAGDYLNVVSFAAGVATLDWSPTSAFQPLDADLTAIAALAGTGIAVRSAADTWVQRSVVNVANQTTVTNGSGAAGNITVGTVQDIATGSSPTFAGLTINGQISTTTGIVVGSGGDLIKKILSFQFAGIDLGSLGAGGQTSFTLTVTGSAVDDFAIVEPPSNFSPDFVHTWAFTAADTLTIFVRNVSGVAFDAPAGTWRVFWFDIT